ncbi:MAG: hypothetical protein AMXMBFR53_23270 [Gemmatimonadota bacterium]
MRWTSGWSWMLLVAAPLAAQERPIEELDLPRDVAEEVIAFFNDPGTVRLQGRAEVPAGRLIQGDVAVLGGPVHVAGEIRGDLVVVNGDLVVAPGGRITGDVTVVGGDVVADPDAVGGQLAVYSEVLPFRRRGESITYDERPWAGWGERRRQGNSYFSVRTEGNYNRVEGLPVMFGPVFRSEGENYLRVDALGVWRSEAGIRLAPREWGYLVRGEQHFGTGGRFSLGLQAHSLVDDIEDGGLRNVEASMATFFLHRDYRDYFERQGFSGYVRFEDPQAGVRLTAEYRDEEMASVPERSPWTIRSNDQPWRPQPLVAEGTLRTVGASIRVDDRNDRDDPSDGWYMEASATRGVGGSLLIPVHYDRIGLDPGASVTLPARPVDTDFTAGSLDLRRYARLGPSADLRLRGFLGGSVDGTPLPPQFQRALGGEGTLPGFPLMSVDCGARAREYSVFREVDDVVESQPTYVAYGCDRVALFQAEYRGNLSLTWDFGGNENWDEGWGWYPTASISPSWSVFFDAGRGWTASEPGEPGWLGPDSETLMDVGVGFFLGDLGLYWAWPLTGDDRDVNFFIRFDHRF